MSIQPALRAFMENLIDYAGLFPPADLSILESIQNYARYRQEPECWMLGRFIIPARRLGELTGVGSDILAADEPFSFSVIGSSGSDADGFRANLRQDVEAIRQFANQHGERVKVDIFEVAVSPELGSLEFILEDIKQALEIVGIRRLFVEASPTRQTLAALADHEVGFKLRCGGKVIPTPAQVAQTILACRDYGIPMKFTAGLHLPLRQSETHGFFNIFGAGHLAERLPPHDLEQLISDTDASHFVFDERGFSWAKHTVTDSAIKQQRREFLLSYGSCSFDEPREALRALHLL